MATFIYSGSIPITGNTTVKCIATSSSTPSNIISNIYNFTSAIPIPFPLPTGFQVSQTINLTSITSGSKIFYTTDNSIPNTGSFLYNSGSRISFSGTTTIKAFSFFGGYSDSSIFSGTYSLQVAIPSASPAAGTYTSSQNISLSSATSGATIYYTTDNSVPTTGSNLYSGLISITSGETIKAIGIYSGQLNSNVLSSSYIIAASIPVASPSGGVYPLSSQPLLVSLSSATSGATIYYTTDNSVPTTGSNLYSSSIPISGSTILQSFAVFSGLTNSSINSSTYTFGTMNLVTGQTLGLLRNDYGFMGTQAGQGLQFKVGLSDITLVALGRFIVSGNSQSHQISIYNSTSTSSSIGSVTINTLGQPIGTYVFGLLNSPIVCTGNNTYYMMSNEISAGDFWSQSSTVLVNSGVSIVANAFDNGGGTIVSSQSGSISNGPVNFQYK